MRIAKLGAAIGTIALALLLVSESRASISTTLAGWQVAGATGETVTPVTFALTNVNPGTYNGLSPLPVAFNNPTPGNYNVNVDPELGSGFVALGLPASGTPSPITLTYTVSVPTGYVFTSATVGFTGQTSSPAAAATVSETLNGAAGPTTSTTNPDTVATPRVSTITVVETIEVTQGAISDITDTFSITPVPEPASLLVWGVLGFGGIGFSVLRSRRKAA